MKLLLALLLIAIPLVDCEGQTARNVRRANFNSLGSPASGNETRSCPDCAVGDPCTGGGTGAYAYASPTGDRWICTDHAPGGDGSGSVTSVSLSLPNIFSVSGSPVTSSGTLTGSFATQSANRFFAGPASGSASTPSFRSIVAADLGTGTADSTKFLRGDLTWQTALGSVTSVALSTPVEFTVSGSPVTGAGTLAFTKANQSANLVYAGPTTGAGAQPGFRSLVANDLPSIAESKFLFSDITTANASTVMHGLLPKLSGSGSDCLRGDGSWLACGGGGGGGDFSTNTTTSVANQVVVASGTGGKTGQFATGTGVGIFNSGVLSFKTNPSGAFIGDTDTQTLSNKTLTLPTIGSFANANHNHTNSAGGGQLTLSAFSSTTGSGATVGQTSATLVTPNIGVATATSVNKVAITAPATSATLTIGNGKTATFNNSVAFSGTDSTVMTFPGSTDTVMGLSAAQSVTGAKTFTDGKLVILGGSYGANDESLPPVVAKSWLLNTTSNHLFFGRPDGTSWDEALLAGASGVVSKANGGTGTANPSGTITISGATSGSATFATAFSAAPRCTLTPTSDPGSGVRWWVTQTTTTVTANTSSSVTLTFNYLCISQ